jgi:lactoylglutathione lyase
MQGVQLGYAIKFVADMDKAVKFYRDVLGLRLKFESPGWSEFGTGETTLALHPASDKNPARKVELVFTVADVEAFYRDMSAKGVLFSMPQRGRISGGCWRSSSIPKAHIAAWAQRRRRTQQTRVSAAFPSDAVLLRGEQANTRPWARATVFRVLGQQCQQSHDECKALQPSSRFQHGVHFDSVPPVSGKERGTVRRGKL